MIKNSLKVAVLTFAMLSLNVCVYAADPIDTMIIERNSNCYTLSEHPDLFDGNFENGELVNGSITYVDLTDGTFEFSTPKKRISSDGSFTFEIGYSVTSTKFQASDTRIVISSTAKIVNPLGEDVTGEYPDHRYAIDLIYGGGQSRTFYADGETLNTVQFNVSKDKDYKIRIRNVDYLPAGTNVVGEGNITNYIHP